MTRIEFARRLGVTVRAVSYWECGRSRPTTATLRAMRFGTVAHVKPTPEMIRRARMLAHLRQREAAKLLSVGMRYWQGWEYGDRTMPAHKWALFLTLVKLPQSFTADYDPFQTTWVTEASIR